MLLVNSNIVRIKTINQKQREENEDKDKKKVCV